MCIRDSLAISATFDVAAAESIDSTGVEKCERRGEVLRNSSWLSPQLAAGNDLAQGPRFAFTPLTIVCGIISNSSTAFKHMEYCVNSPRTGQDHG